MTKERPLEAFAPGVFFFILVQAKTSLIAGFSLREFFLVLKTVRDRYQL